MPTYGRFVPDYNHARLYSLRGVVCEHGIRETGWWIFAERIPVIRIRLREDQCLAFNRIARNGNLPVIKPILNLGMSEEERGAYPVGTEVGICIGCSGEILQYFFGNDPLKLMQLQIMQPGDRLENELQVSA